MGDWRGRVTKVIKGEIASAQAPKALRELGNALSSMQPYEEAAPRPVRVVKGGVKKRASSKRRGRKVWRRRD